MIRVHKSPVEFECLKSRRSFNDESVVAQLLSDQHRKCYLCERRTVTDFEVEHHKSERHHPELIYAWDNLFLACSYCNGKKQTNFDDMVHPASRDVEREIRQTVDFALNRVDFTPRVESAPHRQTCVLLERIYNGTGRVRTEREKSFYDYFLSRINDFQRLLLVWLLQRKERDRRAVEEQLSPESEFLGIKYWILRSNPEAWKAFGPALASGSGSEG